jgi:ABC-type transport system substrate-binding protein
MKKVFILIYLISLSSCFALRKKHILDNCDYYWDKNLKDEVFTKVDRVSFYKNDDPIVFLQDFMEGFKYPNQDNIQTKIVLEVIIDKKGRVKIPTIYQKDSTTYTKVDREAIRAISLMNDWTPGFCHDKKVNTKRFLSVNLELRE